MRRSGHTLIELLIVVLAMGILTAVAAPRYVDALNRFRVDAAARRIAADLNLVRDNANTKGAVTQTEWVSFYATSNTYRMVYDPDLDRPSDEYYVDLDETAYPCDLVSASFTNENGYISTSTVKYDMYGRAHSGGGFADPEAPLVDGQIVVASGGQVRTVVISPITGRARVQ